MTIFILISAELILHRILFHMRMWKGVEDVLHLYLNPSKILQLPVKVSSSASMQVVHIGVVQFPPFMTPSKGPTSLG